MSSYIPEHYYGHIPGTHPMQYGLLPWPAHLKPRQLEPLPDIDLPKLFNEPRQAMPDLPTLVDAGGVFFLTLSIHDRVGIATTIERLIDMLDALDGDPDLEPYLAGYHDLDGDREGDGGALGMDEDFEPLHGWPNAGQPINEAMCADDDREIDNADWEPSLGSVQWYPRSQDNLAFGVRLPPSSERVRTRDCSQESWASGSGDDREEECEDEGAQDDREYSLGWQDEGNQGHLQCAGFGDGDMEADLGTTEEIDQVRRLERAGGYLAGEDEPSLGWAESAGKGIVGQQNCLDDREHEDEREDDPAELGIADDDAKHSEEFIFGDGSGVTIARNMLRQMNGQPPLVEKATKQPDGTVMRRFEPRDDATMIPEIDFLAHYRAAHERLQ